MNSDNIILRGTDNPPLLNKDDVLTIEEIDSNFIAIYNDFIALSNAEDTTLTFDVDRTYLVGEYSTYDGRMWVATEISTGVTPIEGSADWNDIFPTILAHEKNKDTILDEGGANETTVAEIRAFIDAGLTSTTNLTLSTKTATSFKIESSTGADVTIPQANNEEAGLLNATDKVKLNNLTGVNTGDQTLGSLNAEDVDNKVTDFTTINDTLYPTTQAVDTYLTAQVPPLVETFIGGIVAQDLQDVTTVGNTTTDNIEFTGGVGVLFDNTSTLRKGTIDAGYGGAKGIAQICSVGYELKWEAGRLYVMGDGGTTIREVSHNFTTTPSATDDNTKGFIVGSRWILDDGSLYVCTDVTTATAVWVLKTFEDTTNKAIDFTTVNDTKYPTVKAVDDHINSKLAGLWDDRGSYDASTNLFPSSGGSGGSGAILKGDIWTINVQGTLGGVVMHVGDTVRALIDTPAQTSTNWALLENAIGYVPENVTNKVTTFSGNTTSDTKYPSVKAVVDNFTSSNIKTILGISTLSGSNTGDQDLSTLMVKANNLSDLTNTTTARTNLGLGTLATQSGTFSGTSSGTNTGDQVISDATIITTDITTNNFTTAKHGFVPKGTNVGNYLKDDGTWGAISAGGLTYFTEAQATTGVNATVYANSLTTVSATASSDFVIQAKGNGSIVNVIPDGTATGGNKRGTKCLDLQTSRTSAARIAGGTGNVILNGVDNYITSPTVYSVVIGQNSGITGGGNSLVVGDSCQMSGTNSLAVGSCTVTGSASASIGGSSVSGGNSLAVGAYGTVSGTFCIGAGRGYVIDGFYSAGFGLGAKNYGHSTRVVNATIDASGNDVGYQGSWFQLAAYTTSATATLLYSYNGSNTSSIDLQNNNLMRIKGMIIGKQVSSVNSGVWDIDVTVVRGATSGTVAILGTPSISLLANTGSFGTPTITTSSSGIDFKVIGLVSTTIKWSARLDTVEVIA